MRRWISKGDPEWHELFRTYTDWAFRLEAQQTYASGGETEAVARFMAGGPHGLSFEWALGNLADNTAAGHRQDTVRVAVEPPNDYTRWELSVYPEFDAAGETIHVIGVAGDEWPLDVPHHDFWFFDDTQVWRMHYDTDHRFIGAALLDEPEELVLYRRWRDAALAQAVSIHDYLAAHPKNGRPLSA